MILEWGMWGRGEKAGAGGHGVLYQAQKAFHDPRVGFFLYHLQGAQSKLLVRGWLTLRNK